MTYDTINDARTIAGNAEWTPSAGSGTPMNMSVGDGPTMRPKDERAGRGAFAPGDTIARRYVVEKILGEGGMGIVYQCLDKVGGVKVAVKSLPPEVSRNADKMEDIRANYRLVSCLQHQNIAGARTLELDESTGDFYLVMDLARGIALKRWMRRNPQATTEAKLAILRQVAAALDYAHSKKVIHRDVKPENVMVSDDGVVKVLDFGLAAQIGSSQSSSSAVVTSKGGTPGYKSPEQWRGKPQREPADVYSFGVMAYWMFAGELPFDGDDLVVLGHAVLTEPVEPVAGIPDYMNAALAKALAKKPEERYASCGEFFAAFEGKNLSRAEHVGQVERVQTPVVPPPVSRVPRGRQMGGKKAPRARVDVKARQRRTGQLPGGDGFAGQKSTPKDASAMGEKSSGVSLWRAAKTIAKKTWAGIKAAAKQKLSEPCNEHEKIQLWKDGPYWATVNIGAAKPWEFGYYFWWGGIVGYKRVNGKWEASDRSPWNFSFENVNVPTGCKDIAMLKDEGWITADGVLASEHDAGHVQWHGNWRMPTGREIADLHEKCDWAWTTMNGVNGYVVRGRGDYASARIFLPAAGRGNGTKLFNVGAYGGYWSSVLGSDNNGAKCLNFTSGYHYTDYDYRSSGQSIRPVQGPTR